MAYINKLNRADQGRQRPQNEAIEAEFIPLNFDGNKFIQINTSGSAGRQERGKQSQIFALIAQRSSNLSGSVASTSKASNAQTH